MTNKEKDTLVILIPGFPGSEADTNCLPMQQRFIRNLKNGYPELNIIILAFQYPFRIDRYEWYNIPVRSFNGHNKGGINKLLLRRKIYCELKKISNKYHLKGLLSFWYGECALAGKRFADKHGLKHFCWLMGQDARPGNKYPRRTRLQAGELIALSDFLKEEFEKNHGISPLQVIPPGMDDSPVKTTERNIHIIGAGSLIKLKQFDIFLEIIAELKKTIPGIKAVLAGDGPEKKNLLQLVSGYGLQDNCFITGEMPYKKMQEQMQGSKILLHTSSYEGFSGVCQEALYNGARVISFCRAMNRDIEGWDIVKSKEEMITKALDILKNYPVIKTGNNSFLMNDTARSVVDLFD